MAIHEKKSIVGLFFTVLTVAVVALFVVSFATPASAQTFTTTGKIMSIDKKAKTLTIDTAYSREAKGSATELKSFSFTRGGTGGGYESRPFEGSVWMGNEKKDFADLNVGDVVTVNYHQESGGLVIADGITINAPAAVTMHPEERTVVPSTSGAAAAFSLNGKVVSIDLDARTLAVSPVYPETYSGSREVQTFALDNTSLFRGDQSATLRDIKVGDLVTVNYHQESNGRIVADSIAINPPVTKRPEQGSVGFSLSGKIVSLDKKAGTFMVQPSAYSSEMGRSFYLDSGASIMLGDRIVTLNDLNIGDEVTVNYHQDSSGRIIADSVAITAPETAPFPEERG